MARQAPIRIGTRGSPLALAQAGEARRRLLDAHPALDPDEVVIEVIKTSGDKARSRPLAEIGRKGVFVKEIEEALLAGRIDLAVHSMKDMPALPLDGLAVSCLLPREDPRDAFIGLAAATLSELPRGAVVGTASIRRKAQLLRSRPDLRVVNFRGNVETRLRKVSQGQVDGTILALAGLKRLGISAAVTSVFEVDEMLPAVAQGAIGIQSRVGDVPAHDLIGPLNDAATATCVGAERALLAALGGSCRSPIAALAELDGSGGLRLRARVLSPDGRQIFEATRQGPAREAQALGRDAGQELRRAAGADFLESLG